MASLRASGDAGHGCVARIYFPRLLDNNMNHKPIVERFKIRFDVLEASQILRSNLWLGHSSVTWFRRDENPGWSVSCETWAAGVDEVRKVLSSHLVRTWSTEVA